MAVQPPDKERLEVKSDNFEFIQVFDGDKGWTKMGAEAMEMSKDQVAENKEAMYAHRVGRLYSLRDKDFKLSALPEVKVGSHVALGIKVEHKDHRPINLYFDKKSGMLIKIERKAKEFQGGQEGMEFTEETLYEDFKDVNGIKLPHKVVITRDGKKYVEEEVKEAKVSESLDKTLFNKP